MKPLIKLSFVPALLAITFTASAQKQSSDSVNPKNNIIKLNLSALVIKNISLQYERKVSRKSSFALNVHMIPFGQIPLKSTVEKIIDDPSVNVNDLKFGSFGIIPEYRFYVGKKGALHGFYFGPFVSYNKYKTDLPIKYDDDTKTGIFSGKLSALTFGLQLGAQWQLGKNVYLDWWIIGPNYGSAKGDLIFNAALSDPEVEELTQTLEDLKNDAPLGVIKDTKVNNNGAAINVKGPWAGLRGLGINIGFIF